MGITFDDLVFESHLNHGSGVQAKHTFSNGYSVSVILTPYSYGGEDGLYELAVLSNGGLDYTTPVTNDVEGHLSVERVEELLLQVESLPALVEV